MPVRAVGLVHCAHCRREGARTECPWCRLTICAACASDWTTCDRAAGRVFRLGATARLRDVDPSGRHGLVSSWRGGTRVLDLRAPAWVAAAAPLPRSGCPAPATAGCARRRPEPAWCAFAAIAGSS
jgi:hypothetical protein